MIKDKYKRLFEKYKEVRNEIETIPDREDRQKIYGEIVQFELDLKEKCIEKGEDSYDSKRVNKEA